MPRKGPRPPCTSAMKKLTAFSARSEDCFGAAIALKLVKHEKRAERDQGKAAALAPGQRVLQVHGGKHRKHRQRHDLLDRLELRRAVDIAAVAVGLHRQTILEKRQPPANQDHPMQRY